MEYFEDVEEILDKMENLEDMQHEICLDMNDRRREINIMYVELTSHIETGVEEWIEDKLKFITEAEKLVEDQLEAMAKIKREYKIYYRRLPGDARKNYESARMFFLMCINVKEGKKEIEIERERERETWL